MRKLHKNPLIPIKKDSLPAKSKNFQSSKSVSMIGKLCPNFMCQRKLLKILLHCNETCNFFGGAFVLLLQYPSFKMVPSDWGFSSLKGLHGIGLHGIDNSTQPLDPTSCFELIATVANYSKWTLMQKSSHAIRNACSIGMLDITRAWQDAWYPIQKNVQPMSLMLNCIVNWLVRHGLSLLSHYWASHHA
jgi:hypothetical protein